MAKKISSLFFASIAVAISLGFIVIFVGKLQFDHINYVAKGITFYENYAKTFSVLNPYDRGGFSNFMNMWGYKINKTIVNSKSVVNFVDEKADTGRSILIVNVAKPIRAD